MDDHSISGPDPADPFLRRFDRQRRPSPASLIAILVVVVLVLIPTGAAAYAVYSNVLLTQAPASRHVTGNTVRRHGWGGYYLGVGLAGRRSRSHFGGGGSIH